MMKIGILGTRGIPNRYGGFEQFAADLSVRLVRRGHEVAVYTSSRHPYREKNWQGAELISCADPEKQLGTAGQFIYDLNCLKHAARRHFDVLLHLGYTSDAVWHRYWPRQSRHIVNMDGLEWKRSKYSKTTRWFLKKSEGLAARHADIMVADSPVIRDYLFNRYGRMPVYIPYGAEVFTTPDAGALQPFGLIPGRYFLLIARMEPENNIRTVVEGYLAAQHTYPLLVMGNTGNRYGRWLQENYRQDNLVFMPGIYDTGILNNLRYYSALYFHGHAVGGTNPSLLEAMASSATIAAHDNPFNRYVLGEQAFYFSRAEEITRLLRDMPGKDITASMALRNRERIAREYDPEIIADAYERLMENSSEKKIRIPAASLADE